MLALTTFNVLSLSATGFAIMFGLIHSRKRRATKRNDCNVPPGPRGWPVIGNVLPAQERLWHVFSRWAREYGDIMFVQIFNTRILVLSSAEAALDLFEKRSNIYSDKPISTIDDMTGWEFNLALMPYGNRWRSVRKCFHQYFNNNVVSNYHAKQTQEVHAFLRRCLDHAGQQLDPAHVRLTLARTIIDIVYGLEIQSMDDEYMKLTLNAINLGVESRNPAKYWVDYMPFLRYVPAWVPGTASVRIAQKCRPYLEEMVNRPYDALKAGTATKPCMAADIIARLKQEPNVDIRKEQDVYAKHATGIAYSGGSDTTYSAIQTFLCSMAKYPEIQKKAREELDLVVGHDRLPTFDDYESLPYVQAIFLECARWLPVFPAGLPHRVTKDDFYKGYFIPEGTNVIINIWHILRNPEDYPDPERFNPDRFIKDGKLDPTVRDPTTFYFGIGRRVCPGRHFAKDISFLIFASVLHVFDVMPPLDEDGNELDPTPEMSNGVISYPEPLRYILKPRSEAAEKLIRATGL